MFPERQKLSRQELPSAHKPDAGATHRRTCHGERGFTLLELLVVIGVITVLTAILLPAVTLVRQAAQTTKCLSNLKQIGIAITAYANQNNGCLVPGDYFGLQDQFPQLGAGSWANILADQGYITVPIAYYNQLVVQNSAGFATNAMDDNILRCPSGAEYDAAAYGYPTSQTDGLGTFYFVRGSDTTNSAVRNWYAINCVPRIPGVTTNRANDASSTQPAQDFLRPLPFSFLPDSGSGSANWQINRLGQFTDDVHLPLVFDGVWCFNMDPARINARHGSGQYTNILFADFHCETQETASLPNDNWYLK